MSSSAALKYDANMAYPVGKSHPNESISNQNRLCYHRFHDNSGVEQEIFVPPGKEQEVIDLDKNKDWDALLKFPAFSDRPPVTSMEPNCVIVPGADGTTKSFYVPEDTAKQARAYELVVAKDYQTLEQEFEAWNDQPHSSVRQHEEWKRGVERCAYAREEEATKQQAE